MIYLLAIIMTGQAQSAMKLQLHRLSVKYEIGRKKWHVAAALQSIVTLI